MIRSSSRATRRLGIIGLCATAGARLSEATTIIGVDTLAERLEMARRLGADHVVDFKKVNPVDDCPKPAKCREFGVS
jgi:threonine dehydrogenase-like Zn-dependent dehydrogenase